MQQNLNLIKKNVAGVDKLDKVDLAILKSNVDILNISKIRKSTK